MENVTNFPLIVLQWMLTANAHNVNGATISTVIKNVNLFHPTVIKLIHMENAQNVNQAILLTKMENALLSLFLQIVLQSILTTNALNVNGDTSLILKANVLFYLKIVE